MKPDEFGSFTRYCVLFLGHRKKMRDSQKFVPPTRTNTRTVQPDAGSSGTPKCRRLYSDPADANFSIYSTHELLKTPKPPTPRNNHQTQETGLPMGKPFVRRLQRNQKAKQTTERAVTSPSSNLTQMSPSLLAPKSLKSIERQTANVDHESNQLMTSEAISPNYFSNGQSFSGFLYSIVMHKKRRGI